MSTCLLTYNVDNFFAPRRRPADQKVLRLHVAIDQMPTVDVLDAVQLFDSGWVCVCVFATKIRLVRATPNHKQQQTRWWWVGHNKNRNEMEDRR